MAFDRAKTALATLEEKLRRQLGLAGTIGASFAPELKPVILTGDLREPGNGFFKGRHWAVSYNFQFTAGNETASILFNADVIVLGLDVTFGGAGNANSVWLTTPTQSSGVATPTAAGLWIDRRAGTDVPPIFVGGPGALTGTASAVSNQILTGGAAAGEKVSVPMAMFLTSGSAVNIRGVAAAFGHITLWGRIAEST